MTYTPTDEQIEKAARALAEEFGWRDFETLDPQALDTARAGVRAVLVAVGPIVAESAWDEGYRSGDHDRTWGSDGPENPYIEKEAGR